MRRPSIPTYLHAYVRTCLHAYMPTCLHAYMPSCLHIYGYGHSTWVPNWTNTHFVTTEGLHWRGGGGGIAFDKWIYTCTLTYVYAHCHMFVHAGAYSCSLAPAHLHTLTHACSCKFIHVHACEHTEELTLNTILTYFFTLSPKDATVSMRFWTKVHILLIASNFSRNVFDRP